AGRRVWRAGLRGTAAERRKQGEQQRCSGELPCSRPGVHDLLVMGTTGSQSRSPSARHLVIMADWRHFATRTRFSAADAHGKRRSMSCLRYRPRATLVLSLTLALAVGACRRQGQSTVPRHVNRTAMAVDSGWVAVAGARLYYESTGVGPPVVLIHGGNLDRRMWDPQFKA